MSSDDEIDVTSVPLSERLEHGKSICYLGAWNKPSNSKTHKNKKKNSNQTPRKHSHSYVVPSSPSSNDQWVVPETPSPYFLGSKKRQNGDKSEPVATKSKRTCLSNRFLQPDWMNFRKKSDSGHLNGGLKNASFSNCRPSATVSRSDEPGCSRMLLEQRISPEDTYEKHSENSNPLSEIDGPSSSLASSSSTSNDKIIRNEIECSRRQCDSPLSFPSTSKGSEGSIEDDSQKNASLRGVRFLDSDSDSDEMKPFNNAPLKGGHQIPGYFQKFKKIIGKRARRVLDCDDSSDNEWQNQQHQMNNHLSSDSDDSNDIPVLPRKKQFTKHSLAQLSSSDSNEESVSSTAVHPGRETSKDTCPPTSTKNHLLTAFETKCNPEHTVEANGNAISSASSVPSHSGQNSTSSPFLTLRNRFSRNKGSSRRSISPHPRLLNTQNHTSVNSRSSFNDSEQQDFHQHLLSQFPDLFDAEDSSEVEFFTARSYSDTETSAESVGAIDLNNTSARHPCHRNNSTVLLGGSSDEEISVIFSASNASNSDAVNRRGRNRGPGLRRRRTRGSGRIALHSMTQDVVSVSPDPVAQVRQVEEDERYARMLQAEFDAEVNEVATYVSTTDSDESAIIDPVGLDSPPTVPFVPPPPCDPFPPHSPQIHIRGRSRIPIHANMSGGRRRRGRRNMQVHQGDPSWMWQFARVLGLGPTHHHHHHHHHYEPDDSDYEALIHLAESVGEAIPRGLRKTEINRLPTRRFYLPGSASTSQVCDEIIHKRTELNKECQVCLCDYENGDVLRILPCFHEFHTPCIDPWLKINHTCPVCRVEVAFDE